MDSIETLSPARRSYDIKSELAGGLRAVAEVLKRKSDQVSRPEGLAGVVGRQTAEWLDQSAEYVDKTDLQQMRLDVADQVRRNPGSSLLIAGVAGLFLGAIFRRR
jgi:ElaB/YqjD/DUF883 family membrane-anchored ribosome-binding protein